MLRRLHRQVGRFLTTKDAVDVARSLTEQLRDVDAIGQETALVGKRAHRGDQRQLVARRQLYDALAMPHREWDRRRAQRTPSSSRNSRDTRVDLCELAHRHIQYVERELSGC